MTLAMLAASHPAWVCGLKLCFGIRFFIELKSHPAWVCGLKLANASLVRWLIMVTPCVGVWIETLKHIPCKVREVRHTLRGCVD